MIRNFSLTAAALALAAALPFTAQAQSKKDSIVLGMVLEPAVKYQRVAQKYMPRDNH